MGHVIIISCLMVLMLTEDVENSAVNIWTYTGPLGPDHWHLDYPHCGGVKQSPINLVTKDVIVDPERLPPIIFNNYDTISGASYELSNNGHTVQVELTDGFSEISNGGLPGIFVAKQFHFHWGREDRRGSEHAINAMFFPMEMHIVHYNKKYENFTNALNKQTDGLAVLAFFFKVGQFNHHFQEIISHFNEIQYKNELISIKPLPLVQLLPAKLKTFYRYEGSLTTPPCYESVQWTLFNETIEIAEEQLENFRTSLFENEETDNRVKYDVSDDYRPIQCMFRRRVYASRAELKFSADAVFMASDVNAPLSVSTIVIIINMTLTTNFKYLDRLPW